MNSAFSALKEHWRLKKTHSSENCRTPYARNEAQNLFVLKNLGLALEKMKNGLSLFTCLYR